MRDVPFPFNPTRRTENQRSSRGDSHESTKVIIGAYMGNLKAEAPDHLAWNTCDDYAWADPAWDISQGS
jgi:hypothetical protein